MLPHPKVAEIHAYYYLRIVPSPRKLAKYTYLHLIYAQKVAKNAWLHFKAANSSRKDLLTDTYAWEPEKMSELAYWKFHFINAKK